MSNEYDEIKSLLKKTRMLMEQTGPLNLAKSVEDNIEDDSLSNEKVDPEEVKKEKSKTYRISGGLLSLYGKDKKDLELTSEEKNSFQETMDDFVQDVSDLTEFGKLNVYENSVEWSGKILDSDIEFFYTIGEETGVYINGDMIKLDNKLVELINKLTTFHEKFKTKWAKVIGMRKKTKLKEE
jgi:hypothetical protein